MTTQIQPEFPCLAEPWRVCSLSHALHNTRPPTSKPHSAAHFKHPNGSTKSRRQSLIQNLVKLARTAPSVNINIPPEVMSYVENSRNPDIFTREFVETVQRMNQMLYGRVDAYRALQEQLALHVSSAIPELKDDVNSVVESTGGKVVV
ncbi:hypothetical protein IG631_20372 [Alternaria alternata]|nr:hypothetical protein IG631_20372 [Alternaria alternata]